MAKLVVKKESLKNLPRSLQEFRFWEYQMHLCKPEIVKEYIYETLKDKKFLHIFGAYFFPHIIKTIVPDCHLELIEEISKPKDSAIIFPRGFGKSSWIKIDTIHDIVYSLEPVILYISDVLGAAKFHFNSIKMELENNELLREVYGDLVPKVEKGKSYKWSDTHFETTNGVNCVARGATKGRGVNIKNKRPTKIIFDDIENDELVRSSQRRQKLNHWINFVIVPSKDKERGKIKMIGTVLHESCELLKFYKQYGGIYKKAIENGRSIWEDYWTLKDLEKKKEEMGSRAFAQEYMNEAVSDEIARFNPLWIEENYYTILPENIEKMDCVIAIDPQSGESKQADEFAITVVAWIRGDIHRYIVEQISGRGSITEQMRLVLETWLRYRHARVIGIEKLYTQTALFQSLLSWKSGNLDLDGLDVEDRNIPLKAIDPKGRSKVDRLQIHEPAFERGEIHLRPTMRKLRDQLLFLGLDVLEHDDCADSCIMALDLSYKHIDKLSKNKEKLKEKTIVGNLYNEQF